MEAVGAEFDAEERFGKFMRLGAGGLMEGGTGLDPEATEHGFACLDDQPYVVTQALFFHKLDIVSS